MNGAWRVICAIRALLVVAAALACAHGAGAASSAKLEQEVQRFAVACAKNEDYPMLYDCRCLSEGYREAVKETGSTFRRRALVRDYKLLQQCPAAKSSIYAWFRQDCISNAGRQPNHGDFCSCSAEAFATAFLASPPASKGEIDSLEKASMRSCGAKEQLPMRHPQIDLK
jgi:hypothetical protein